MKNKTKLNSYIIVFISLLLIGLSHSNSVDILENRKLI